MYFRPVHNGLRGNGTFCGYNPALWCNSKTFHYRWLILLLPKPSADLPVYPDQLSANQRVSALACLAVTIHEMFNLQIYWLNQAIVTLTASHLLSLSHRSLSHSLRLQQTNKKYCKSLYLQQWLPTMYRVADKSLARPTSPCILFDGKNISFDASLVVYIKTVLIFLQLWL